MSVLLLKYDKLMNNKPVAFPFKVNALQHVENIGNYIFSIEIR